MEIRRCPACRKIAADSRAVSCPGCETPLVLADEKSLLGEVFGSYRLVDVLGAGGMGVVFRARHETLLREAALKLVRPNEAQETFAKRFLQEARLLAELEHPNIVAVYDFAVTAWGDPFLVMELLPGRALADLLAEAPQGLSPE